MDERLINSLPEMLATAGNVFLLWLCLHGNLRAQGVSYEAWVLYLRLLCIMMAGWENCKQPLKTCYLWSKDNQRDRERERERGLRPSVGEKWSSSKCLAASAEEATCERESETGEAGKDLINILINRGERRKLNKRCRCGSHLMMFFILIYLCIYLLTWDD